MALQRPPPRLRMLLDLESSGWDLPAEGRDVRVLQQTKLS